MSGDVIDLAKYRRRTTQARIDYLDDLADRVRAKADQLRDELEHEPVQLSLLDAEPGA